MDPVASAAALAWVYPAWVAPPVAMSTGDHQRGWYGQAGGGDRYAPALALHGCRRLHDHLDLGVQQGELRVLGGGREEASHGEVLKDQAPAWEEGRRCHEGGDGEPEDDLEGHSVEMDA